MNSNVRDRNIKAFRERKWGVMCHYLHHHQNNPKHFSNEGVGETAFSDMIDAFDVQGLAKQLHEMGAGYLLFTIMQGTQYMCAPNETYDKITGYKAGEACSKRDLPLELYEELKKYDIDLYLYFTGDGPHKDEQGGRAIGYYDGDKHETMHACAVEWIEKHSFSSDDYKGICDDKFIQNWSSVLKEYAERYKGKIKGWWIDGCYRYFGYTDENLKIYRDVLKNADENYLITFNDGFPLEEEIFHHREPRQHRYSVWEDYTAGETVAFNIFPDGPYIGGSQWHIASTLSGRTKESFGWNDADVCYSLEFMQKYLETVWAQGGVVTFGLGTRRCGLLWEKQVQFLKELNSICKKEEI